MDAGLIDSSFGTCTGLLGGDDRIRCCWEWPIPGKQDTRSRCCPALPAWALAFLLAVEAAALVLMCTSGGCGVRVMRAAAHHAEQSVACPSRWRLFTFTVGLQSSWSFPVYGVDHHCHNKSVLCGTFLILVKSNFSVVNGPWLCVLLKRLPTQRTWRSPMDSFRTLI